MFIFSGCISTGTSKLKMDYMNHDDLKVEIPDGLVVNDVINGTKLKTALVLVDQATYDNFMKSVIQDKDYKMSNDEVHEEIHHEGKIQSFFEHIVEKYTPIGFRQTLTTQRLLTAVDANSLTFNNILLVGVDPKCNVKKMEGTLPPTMTIQCDNHISYSLIELRFQNLHTTYANNNINGSSERKLIFKIKFYNNEKRYLAAQGNSEIQSGRPLSEEKIIQILKDKLAKEQSQSLLMDQAICHSGFSLINSLAKKVPSGGKIYHILEENTKILSTEGKSGLMKNQSVLIIDKLKNALALANVFETTVGGRADMEIYKYKDFNTQELINNAAKNDSIEFYAVGLGVTREFVNEASLCKVSEK